MSNCSNCGKKMGPIARLFGSCDDEGCDKEYCKKCRDTYLKEAPDQGTYCPEHIGKYQTENDYTSEEGVSEVTKRAKILSKKLYGTDDFDELKEYIVNALYVIATQQALEKLEKMEELK